MAKLAANRRRSPADVHFRGHKTDRRLRVRHEAGLSYDPTTPSTVSGLKAWWDFSDITTLWQDTGRTSAVTADGQSIKGVTDKSGTANHLSEATNPPTYTVGIIGALSVSRFDGTNDVLSGNITASTAHTTFIVAKKRSQTATAGTLITYGNDSTQLFHDTDNHATGYNWFANQAGAGVNNVGSVNSANVNVMLITCNSAASLDIYGNGGTASNFDPNDSIASAPSVQLAKAFSASNWGDYDIGEVVYYNVALTSANKNTVGTYLAAKWGTTWTTV